MNKYTKIVLVVALGICIVSFILFQFCSALFTHQDGRTEEQETTAKMNRLLEFAEGYWLEKTDGIAVVCMDKQTFFVPASYATDGRVDSWGSKFIVYCQSSMICVRSNGRNRSNDYGKGDDLVLCKPMNEIGG